MDKPRETISNSDPLELLPWGMTLKDLELAAARKRRAGLSCLLPLAVIVAAIILVYLATLIVFGKGA